MADYLGYKADIKEIRKEADALKRDASPAEAGDIEYRVQKLERYPVKKLSEQALLIETSCILYEGKPLGEKYRSLRKKVEQEIVEQSASSKLQPAVA